MFEYENFVGLPIVADLRDPVVFDYYPFLIPIREAVTCVYDFLVEKRLNGRTISIDECPNEQIIRLARALGLTENSHYQNAALLKAAFGEELQEAYWLHKATYGECSSTSRGVAEFLTQRYPAYYTFRLFMLRNESTYFGKHEIVVVKDIQHGCFVGLSPGNIFNSSCDPNKSKYNFTFPKLNGRRFQRATGVIVGRTQEEIIGITSGIEGGKVGNWVDTTDWIYREDSYSYIDAKGRHQAKFISEFIREWNDIEG